MSIFGSPVFTAAGAAPSSSKTSTAIINTTTGDLIVAIAQINGTGVTAAAFSDDIGGNNYTVQTLQGTFGWTTVVAYCISTGTNAANHVTVLWTATVTPGFNTLGVWDIPISGGTPVFDVNPFGASRSSSSTPTTASFNTVGTDEIVLTMTANDFTGITYTAQDGSHTLDASNAISGDMGAQHILFSSAQTGITEFMNQSGSTDWVIASVGFQAVVLNPISASLSGHATISALIGTLNPISASITGHATISAQPTAGMVFTTLASDTFHRAPESPLASPPWQLDTVGDNGLQIVSDACEPQVILPTNGSGEFYTGITWPTDCWAEITIVNFADPSSDFDLLVRDTALDRSTPTGYDLAVNLNGNGPAPCTGIVAFYNDTEEGEIWTSSLTVTNGDIFKVAVVGSGWYVWQNGVLLQSGIDSSVTTRGLTGLILEADPTISNSTVKNFSGGAVGDSISGNVGTAGVTVSYTGTSSGSVTSAADGGYTISGLADGTYTVTPTLLRYTFSPTDATETLGGGNPNAVTSVNFTSTFIVSGGNPSVLGTIWFGGREISGSTNIMGTGQRTGTSR